MASSSVFSVNDNSSVLTLTENDIPGSSLCDRKPEELKNEELRFWLKCRGDSGKGLKTKAQLVKRVHEYITTGKDKDIVDPDPNRIYSRRKERESTNDSSEVEKSLDRVKFPSDGWGISLEKMPMFTRADMNRHIMNSGKSFANKDHHSVPTGLRKAKRFLDDEYLEDIECASDQRYFFFQSKCCHSFRKNDPPHNLKIALCIISGEVKRAWCSCVAGNVGICNHVLALMFKICKFSLFSSKTTKELFQEEEQSIACTSQLQKWHKKGGGSNIAPEPVMEVHVNKSKLDEASTSRSGVKSLLYDARKVTTHNKTAEQKLKDDLKLIDSNMGLAQMASGDIIQPTVDTKFGKCQIGSYLSYQVGFTESNFKAIADIECVPRLLVLIGGSQSYPEFPLRHIPEMTLPDGLSDNEMRVIDKLRLDKDGINLIETETKQQANCNKWKDERKYRFTSSQFFVISRRKRNHDTFADTLMHPKSISSRYLEHGKKFEAVALQQYEKFMHNRRTPVQVLSSGLVVSEGYPILGASPDGKVIDSGCVDHFGLAEVKCPYTKYNVTPLDACSDSKFFMEKLSDNECRLKEDHQYYAQVQGQMAITGTRWCDFIVYTSKGLYVQRIPFNYVYWEKLVRGLTSYYFNHFIKFAAVDMFK